MKYSLYALIKRPLYSVAMSDFCVLTVVIMNKMKKILLLRIEN